MLFDTNHFSSKKITETEPDPAWDDGSAFPVSSKNECVDGEAVSFSSKNLKGDRIEVELCLDNSIYAQDSELVSHWQELSPEDSSLGDCASMTNSAAISSAHASPKSQSTPMCENSGSNQQTQTSSPLRHHANPSQLKENVWEAVTAEIVYPPSCDKLEKVSPNSSVSKTCLDCYQPPLFPETNPEHISNRCSGSFGQVGTMRNGLLSEQPNTIRSGRVKGSCLLPRPGALSWSGNGRPPGTTKSEAKAKKLGIIQKNEVYNPEWLEIQFGLPPGWTSPQEHQAAMELLATVEQHSETASTPESLRSPSNESSTSTQSADIECTQQLITPVNFLEEKEQVHTLSKQAPEKFLEETKSQEEAAQKPKRRERKGCLYKYLENKKLKDGRIVSYPRITENHRDPDNPKHWRWGFNWEEKIDGEWKGRSIGSVPVGAIPMIQSMRSRGVPLEEIIDFIRKSKSKK